MYTSEALSKLYKGREAFSRQLLLFSVCGIVGLFNAYVTIMGAENVNLLEKCAYGILWILFAFFFTGYETLFLHERELPEADMRSFKLPLNKLLFLIFLAGVPLFFTAFFTKYAGLAFVVEMLLTVPLTTLQAGFSYNFNNDDAYSLIKHLNFKNYILLILKRLWVIICSYVIVFTLIFLIFFIAGVVVAVMYRGDAGEIGFTISTNQHLITKLSQFITGILLVYFLTIATLVWDYELVKNLEDDIDN